ncbi:GNAT family N-acetyltransferase [Brochothrix campestris]|uniref:GCN5-like N-acetyltransferase n=1 Tax=Brochothrix campestris FSL F6-1037 TaxID=1265861 RepID=W7CQ82_9LIST|nr:GNAT family N-acetyltransferase [Brochothrix campestris]EUJ39257.1 GCN5-like N-acetyltransferase [Brochothrix campestris FSL F6-1037]
MTVVKINPENTEELAIVKAIREKVFVEEQNFSPDEDNDGKESECEHFLAYDDETGHPVATGRLYIHDNRGKLQRICVLKEGRGKGFGRKIILAIEQSAREEQLDSLYLSAQEHAVPFYEKLGFVATTGERYIDMGGIWHIDMDYKIAVHA